MFDQPKTPNAHTAYQIALSKLRDAREHGFARITAADANALYDAIDAQIMAKHPDQQPPSRDDKALPVADWRHALSELRRKATEPRDSDDTAKKAMTRATIRPFDPNTTIATFHVGNQEPTAWVDLDSHQALVNKFLDADQEAKAQKGIIESAHQLLTDLGIPERESGGPIYFLQARIVLLNERAEIAQAALDKMRLDTKIKVAPREVGGMNEKMAWTDSWQERAETNRVATINENLHTIDLLTDDLILSLGWVALLMSVQPYEELTQIAWARIEDGARVIAIRWPRIRAMKASQVSDKDIQKRESHKPFVQGDEVVAIRTIAEGDLPHAITIGTLGIVADRLTDGRVLINFTGHPHGHTFAEPEFFVAHLQTSANGDLYLALTR